ncbi:HAD family phosphatase [Puniceicoccales bacterium CK1056]|uniref:HAD family phosphatase n=1 Tax=Oceanipulchritudo coccoides TaxID=2706888 RepID=A0A6B2LYI8_9BACT|nr:HAD family phosphatase [Oceanipulchritudo coccoides]NDV61741.1 HAD family phosphatase [Oceanipulchritudo coccoides]
MFIPPKKSYLGYIFDCDGTLADTMPLHLRAWNYGLKAANSGLELDGHSFMSVAGMALEQTIKHWNETHSLQIDAEVVMREKNDYFKRHHEEIDPIIPVLEFARSCKASGAAVSVASGGERPDVLETLRLICMDGFFPVITTAEDVKHSKPAPDLFLLAAEKMGIAPADCLVIEDSLLGIEAADTAGMDSVLVPHPF